MVRYNSSGGSAARQRRRIAPPLSAVVLARLPFTVSKSDAVGCACHSSFPPGVHDSCIPTVARQAGHGRHRDDTIKLASGFRATFGQCRNTVLARVDTYEVHTRQCSNRAIPMLCLNTEHAFAMQKHGRSHGCIQNACSGHAF